jgi:hypothetical protein
MINMEAVADIADNSLLEENEQLRRTVEERDKTIRLLQEKIQYLLNQRFGPKSERLDDKPFLRLRVRVRRRARLSRAGKLLFSGDAPALSTVEPPQSAAQLQLGGLCRADKGLQAPAPPYLPQLPRPGHMQPSAKRVTSRSPVR